MKEGYIIYVVGEDPPQKAELEQLVRENRLDLFEYRLCGRAPYLNGLYRAYQELQQNRVTTINCLSVSFDKQEKRYRFLDQSLNLDSTTDLKRFCTPQELQ
jgi:hypothetical protein